MACFREPLKRTSERFSVRTRRQAPSARSGESRGRQLSFEALVHLREKLAGLALFDHLLGVDVRQRLRPALEHEPEFLPEEFFLALAGGVVVREEHVAAEVVVREAERFLEILET